jgi:hypothetical protein
MQPKSLRVLKIGQGLDILAVVLHGADGLGEVAGAGRVEILVILDDIIVQVFLEYTDQADPVPIISDPASKVDIASHVDQCVPRDILALGQEHLQGLDADVQIAIVELVADVEAEGTELAAFLDDRVEEGQP